MGMASLDILTHCHSLSAGKEHSKKIRFKFLSFFYPLKMIRNIYSRKVLRDMRTKRQAELKQKFADQKTNIQAKNIGRMYTPNTNTEAEAKTTTRPAYARPESTSPYTGKPVRNTTVMKDNSIFSGQPVGDAKLMKDESKFSAQPVGDAKLMKDESKFSAQPVGDAKLMKDESKFSAQPVGDAKLMKDKKETNRIEVPMRNKKLFKK